MDKKPEEVFRCYCCFCGNVIAENNQVTPIPKAIECRRGKERGKLMKATFLATLTIVAITTSTSWGETLLPESVKKIDSANVVCPTGNEEARSAYNDAMQLQHKGRLRDAEGSYLKAIGLDPRYCDAMDNLGQMLRSEGKTERAIFWYQRSLSVKPDDAVAHQNLAVAYIVEGAADKAVAEFQWLIQHDPDNPEGYYGLGNLHVVLGHPKDAVGPLERAEKLYRAKGSPLLADAQYELGVAYYMLKAYAKARSYLELIYSGRESAPNLNYLLGVCYVNMPSEERGKGRELLLAAKRLGMDVVLRAKNLGDPIPEELLRDLGK